MPAGDGGFDGGAGEEGVVEHVGEAGEDGALVERVVLAPVEFALLDVFLGGHAGGAAVLAGEVGGVVDGDGDAGVDVALGVVGVEELAVAGEGVAGEEHARRVEALEGLHLVLGHGVGLGDDDEELGGVEALEVVGAVGGEADGVAVVGDVPLRAGEASAQGDARGLPGGAHLAPDDLLDLALGGAGDDGDGAGAGGEPPEDGARGCPVLAGAVGADDADAALAGEGPEDLALFVVGGRVAQDVFDESDRVVAVLFEDGGHAVSP